MHLTLNGAPTEITAGLSLAELVPTISDRTSGIAVAYNREVIPRGQWPGLLLRPGDRVDVLTAVQGG